VTAQQKVQGRLAGRRAVITGAASGIGQATAALFEEAGAAVALLDANPAVIEVANAMGCHGFILDVTDADAVEATIARAAAALGGVDAVVNAAGIVSVLALEALDPATWQRVIGVNLTGPYLVCRAALPWLRAAGTATIVNIASAQAIRPVGASAVYAASKAGVMNFTKAIAGELAPEIRANVVCPGIVDTPMVRNARSMASADSALPSAKDYPLQRMAQPEEIARAILFLTSSESSYVTGAALAVDGGRTFH
jgi:NAD(P)-dependent dehydrogenase (short-subunit alcohol dehydrogenase family)